MSLLISRYRSACSALAAGCDRLIAESGLAPDVVGLRRRLSRALFAAPVFISAAIAVMAPYALGPASVVVSISLAFALFWLAALIAAMQGREALVGAAALAAAAAAVSAIVALGGGLAAPIALLISGLAIEPWLAFRSRKALIAGGVAALASVGGAALLTGHIPVVPGAVWGWAPVALYLSWVGVRRTAEQPVAASSGTIHLPFDTVMLRLGAKGDVVGVDGDAIALLGLAPEFLANQALFERLHVADRVIYMRALSALRNGADRQTLTLRLRRPVAGDAVLGYQSLQADMRPLRDEATGAVEAVSIALQSGGVIDDLRAELAAALEEVDRLNIAKSAFLASISHELRTPLNAIIGFSDLLTHELYGPLPDPRQREHVAMINDAGHHLLAIVNSILDVSKIELGAYELNPEPFELERAVSSSVAMVSTQAAAKSIDLQTRLDGSLGEINGDCRAVRQILINLLSNAVKFTPAGGQVVVGAARNGDNVDLWVRDTGVGVADADIARIGTPFVQLGGDLSRQHDGAGLGLALVKGLTQLHEGEFAISSRLGAGTTITVTLPISGPSSAQAALPKHDLSAGKDNAAFRKTA